MPTSSHGDDKIDDIYEQINKVIKSSKEKDNLIIMGDRNAFVGETQEQGILGTFELEKINQEGERLVEFCKEQNLIITNTLFLQPKRRRYT